MRLEATHGSLTGWNAVTDATGGKIGAESDAVVALVGGQATGSDARTSPASRHANGLKRGQRSLEIVNRTTVKMQPQGNALAIDDDVTLARQARSRDTNFVAPFLALT
jgi:hypothetical protein